MTEAKIIDRFRVIREVGRGAAATVYEVYDERLNVRRALKRLNPAMFQHAAMRARFLAEARAMARLTHPGVVQVFDVFIADGDAAIVMEFVEGGSLGDRLDDSGPLPAVEAVRALIEVLDALEDAHVRGVIHRDVKPHNLLVDADGRVRLTDFGIARIRDDEQAMTRTGVTMGTWAFMPPEQRTDAKNVDPRTDIYAAGATLFALLTGSLPKDLFAVDLDPELLSGVPAPLAVVIRRATLYHRDERYPSAQAMASALQNAMVEMGLADAPVPTLSRGPSLGALSPLADVHATPRPPTHIPDRSRLGALLGVLGLVGLATAAWFVMSTPSALKQVWPAAGVAQEDLQPAAE
ncbi:MAG: serine/threonine-protein kinase [Myxococcota bacterium]